jgi:hypothetical protein
MTQLFLLKPILKHNVGHSIIDQLIVLIRIQCSTRSEALSLNDNRFTRKACKIIQTLVLKLYPGLWSLSLSLHTVEKALTL